jgi:hypothetical protein
MDGMAAPARSARFHNVTSGCSTFCDQGIVEAFFCGAPAALAGAHEHPRGSAT